MFLQPDATGDETTTAKPFASPDDLLSLATGAAPEGAVARARLQVGGLEGFGCVAFSPDSRYFAAGHWDGRITIWDAAVTDGPAEFQHPTPLTTIIAHEDNVTAIAYGPDSRTLVSVGADHKIVIWDTTTGKPIRQIETGEFAADSLVMSSDGKLFVYGTGLEVVAIDTATGRPKWKNDFVAPTAISPDGATVAIVNLNGINMVDARTGRVNRVLPKAFRYLTRLAAFAPDGKSLAVIGEADDKKMVALLELDSGKVRYRHQLKITGPVAFFSDGRVLAVCNAERIDFLQAESGKKIRSVKNHWHSPDPIAISPDLRHLVVCDGSHASVFDLPMMFDYPTQRAVDQLRKRHASIDQIGDLLKISGIRDCTDGDLKILTAIRRPSIFSPLFDSGITDKGLTHLAGNQQIVELHLPRSEKITDAGLAHLTGLSRLKVLDLSETKITDAALPHLAKMAQLTTLRLPSNLTDAGLAHLAPLTNLVELRVGGDGVTDAGLSHLSGMIGLKKLELIEVAIQGRGLKQLAHFTELEHLHLDSSKTTDEGLSHLPKMAGLLHLRLNGSEQLTDEGLKHLAQTPNLRRLDLFSVAGVKGPGLEHLVALQQLETLRLPNRVDDQDLARLAKLPKLTTLDNWSLRAGSGAGLAAVARARKFKRLDFESTGGTDDSLAHFKGLKHVTELRLPPRATDAGLAHMAGMTRLKILDLGRSRVTDAGLVHLKRMPLLEQLYLNKHITGAGLFHLKNNTRITDVARSASVNEDEYQKFIKGVGKYGHSAASFDFMKESVRSLSFSPDGSTLVVATDKADLARIDVANRKMLPPLRIPITKTESAIYLPDGKSLAIGTENDPVILLDAKTGKPMRKFETAKSLTGDPQFAVSQSGDWLVAAFYSRIFAWELPAGNPSRRADISFPASIECFALSPDGRRIVAHTHGCHIYSVDASTGERLHRWHDAGDPVESVVFSADGKLVASAAWHTIEVRDSTTLDLKHTFRTAETNETLLSLPHYSAIACGRWDGRVTIRRMPSGEHLKTLKSGFDGTVRQMAVSADGKTLAASMLDRVVLWNLSKLLPQQGDH